MKPYLVHVEQARNKRIETKLKTTTNYDKLEAENHNFIILKDITVFIHVKDVSNVFIVSV